MHLKRVLNNGRKKVNQLHSIISNRDIILSAHRLVLLSAIRPGIEYGSEVWEGNKGQTNALKWGGAIKSVGDMGLETLKSHRDKLT